VYQPNKHLSGREPNRLGSVVRKGAVRFERATARHAGQRLAIVVDGTVSSAPVVHARVGGGRIAISMGGHDAKKAFAEAMDLTQR